MSALDLAALSWYTPYYPWCLNHNDNFFYNDGFVPACFLICCVCVPNINNNVLSRCVEHYQQTYSTLVTDLKTLA